MGTDVYRDDLKGYTAFAWFSQAQYADCTWQTIASILKVGDELTLYWQRGGLSHQTMRDAGLHGDALYLRVRRGDKRLVFLIDTYCGQDNTARMVRLSGYSLTQRRFVRPAGPDDPPPGFPPSLITTAS